MCPARDFPSGMTSCCAARIADLVVGPDTPVVGLETGFTVSGFGAISNFCKNG